MKPAVAQTIDFDVIPKSGAVVMFHGQRYVKIGVQPHQRRDGSMTTLIRWATHCARCGDPIEIATTKKASPTRRCPECAQKGVRA